MDDDCLRYMREVNTHNIGFMIISFLISMLWFKINLKPVFPIGLVGAVIIAAWIRDIDLRLGRKTVFTETIALSVLGSILGLIINTL